MPREHRITHPVLGPITWVVLKAYTVVLKKQIGRRLCSWCFGEVPPGCRTRCGSPACESALSEITQWSVCCLRAMRRAGHKCALCSARADEVDHIVPVSLGGTSDASNLRPLCLACHRGETSRLRRDKDKFRARTPYPRHVGARRESTR